MNEVIVLAVKAFPAVFRSAAFFLLIPCFRRHISNVGVAIIACAVGLSSVVNPPNELSGRELFVSSFFSAVLLALPFVWFCESLAFLGRSIDQLRGAQFAEQMANEERSSPFEILFLLGGAVIILNSPGRFKVLSNLQSGIVPLISSKWNNLEKGIYNVYPNVVELLAPLAALSIVLEIFSGTISRVLRKVSISQEISVLRLLLIMLFLLHLLPNIKSTAELKLGEIFGG